MNGSDVYRELVDLTKNKDSWAEKIRMSHRSFQVNRSE